MNSLIEFPRTHNTDSFAPRALATPSAEILRARDLLRDVLMLDDDGSLMLVGHVGASLNEVCMTLDNLAGLQHMFEVWNAS